MPATLSPFRYIQLARYVVQWWLETAPGLQARRKAAQARAAQIIYAPRMRKPLAQPKKEEYVTAAAGGSSAALAFKPTAVDKFEGLHTETELEDLPPYPDKYPDPRYPPENMDIYRLMNDERAFLPGRTTPPKEIVVLCHGLYGFSTATPIPLFPSLKLHYWASVLEVLRDRMGAKVVVVGVKGTGSIQERAQQMHEFLKSYLPRGVGVNFVAHSMGGLDCRHLISTIKPKEYKPLSLMTIATPHRGSPFMDWCAANIGVGSIAPPSVKNADDRIAAAAKYLPFTMKSPLLTREAREAEARKDTDAFSSFTSGLTNYLLNIFDSPAYHNLTTSYMNDYFNPNTPDDPNVKYFSVAGRVSKMSVLHPLWFTKLVLDSAAERGYPSTEVLPGHQYEGNDGLVSVASAKWGDFLGVVDGCHHWDLRGEGGLWPQHGAFKVEDEEARSGDWQALGLSGSGPDSNKKDPQLESSQQHDKDLATARAMSSPAASAEGTPKDKGWDLAHVGQLVDWVSDIFPGDKKDGQETRQYKDAKAEIERPEKEKGEGKTLKKVVRDKFDLARFYGGLMLKLREEGL